MKKTQQLLTIGQLAKFSGLHVKALRYYEKIGILNPTAIDKQNGYRYYSYAHIPYVNMVKICANYDLYLKLTSATSTRVYMNIPETINLTAGKIAYNLVINGTGKIREMLSETVQTQSKKDIQEITLEYLETLF